MKLTTTPTGMAITKRFFLALDGISLRLRSVQMAELSNLNGLLGLLKIITSMPNGY